MKHISLMLGLMFFMGTGAALAENGDQYWLAKAGISWLDKSEKPDNLTAVNLTYGYGLTTNITAELDYQQSIGGGKYKIDDTDGSGKEEKGEYSYRVISLGAAYRYLFLDFLYAKGKLAISFANDERTSSSPVGDNKKDDGVNVSGGLALGLMAGDVVGSSLTLELGVVQQTSDLISVMLGANVTF